MNRKLLSLSIAFAMLTSCSGGDDPDDGLRDYRAQRLSWEPCTAVNVGEQNATMIAASGLKIECARMRVPMDYERPAAGAIEVALSRMPAARPAEREGAILVNPGGPGGDGIPASVAVGGWLAEADTADPASAPYRTVLDRFDLIGFSPRGTGASTRLDCGQALPLRFVNNPARDRSSANLAVVAENNRTIADACLSNPLTPHVHSDATARDMDLVRHLLGDAKLNYLGLSYGTWLGNWYASLFPERVGRMLLIGLADLSLRLNDVLLPQETGMQQVLDEVILPYATRHPDRFRLGTDPAAIRAMLDGLSTELHGVLVAALQGNGIQLRASAPTSATLLRVAQVVQAEMSASPGIGEPALQSRLATTDFVAADMNENARVMAAEITRQTFLARRREVDPPTRNIAGVPAVMWSVVCNDTGTAYTWDSWLLASSMSIATNRDFGGFWRDNVCAYWKLTPRARKATSASEASALILVTERDPWTTLAGARRALPLLPRASMIVVKGDYSHGPNLPYGRACVDRAITDYLLTGRLPARETECEGLPLPYEDRTY